MDAFESETNCVAARQKATSQLANGRLCPVNKPAFLPARLLAALALRIGKMTRIKRTRFFDQNCCLRAECSIFAIQLARQWQFVSVGPTRVCRICSYCRLMAAALCNVLVCVCV